MSSKHYVSWFFVCWTLHLHSMFAARIQNVGTPMQLLSFGSLGVRLLLNYFRYYFPCFDRKGITATFIILFDVNQINFPHFSVVALSEKHEKKLFRIRFSFKTAKFYWLMKTWEITHCWLAEKNSCTWLVKKISLWSQLYGRKISINVDLANRILLFLFRTLGTLIISNRHCKT